MKKRILTLCVAVLTVLALALGACAEGAFDGLEGVVILTPDEGEAGNAAPSVGEQSGLVLTLGDSSVEKAGETYANIIFDVSLMNWDLESYELADAVKATLYYEDAYPFTGAFDFGTDTEIGMLVEETGKLTFSVPQIVALADIEALRLELTVLEDTYAEELTPFKLPDELKDVELPFDYGTRESDALELKLGEMHINDSYSGKRDRRYKWIIQPFYLINWSSEAVELDESVSMLLAYAQRYGFQGEILYGHQTINPLKIVLCRAVFHVPNIVTEAEAGLLSLRITLNGEETEWDYGLGEATKRSANPSGDDAGRPMLGVTVADVDGPEEPTVNSLPIGAQVYAVEDDGPADWAGIQEGDVITEINGVRIRSYQDLTAELDKYAVGDRLELKIYRYYDESGRLTGSFEEKLLWVDL